MAGRFDSAFWKVDRARKHAEDLDKEIRAFWDTDPYEVEMVGAPLAGPGFFRVKKVRALPESIPLLAGDAVHNVRSALDHFAWSAASPRERGRHTCFPVWSGIAPPARDEWRRRVAAGLKGTTADLVEAVVKLESWEGGHEWLIWATHELDRIDKHRLLLPVASAFTGIGLDGDSHEISVARKYSGVEPGSPLVFEPIEWTPLEDGRVLFGSPDGALLSATSATLTFGLALTEPARMRDRPATAWLLALADFTERVIRNLAPLA